MCENIALIKEFHEHKPIKEAEDEAKNYLEKIGLGSIWAKRSSECSELEMFYVMFIRSLMSKEMSVIIVSPFSITTSIESMKGIIENLLLLKGKKSVLILDLCINERYYEESQCSIIK